MDFDINKLATFFTGTIKGRAGQDATLAYSKNGKPILSCTLAINKGPKEQRRTIWVTMKAFQGLAESTQICKGQTVLVEGTIDLSEWTDRQTGAARSRIEILANRIDVLPDEVRPPAQPSQSFDGFPLHATNPFQGISDEDVPF